MDHLVEKLGFLDYRDALAANKYILEAKRQGDYHQQARAKTLALALNRMTKLKREQVDAAVSKQLSEAERGDQLVRDEKKLAMVMNQDPTISKVYQQVLQDIKSNSEKEMVELSRLHSKFDQIYDPESMQDKLDSRWYNLNQIDTREDLVYSTDFTSESEDLLYKRYKMQNFNVKQSIQDYTEMIDNLQREADSWEPQMESDTIEFDDEGNKIGRNIESLLAKAREEHAQYQEKNVYVETKMAQMKFEKAKRNRTNADVFNENDPMFGGYEPEFYKDEAVKKDVQFHPEMRKMMFSDLSEGPDRRFNL